MALTIGFSNSGQACHAATRLIVPASRLPEIKEHLVKAVGVLKVGIPSDSAASIGPMVNAKSMKRYSGISAMASKTVVTLYSLQFSQMSAMTCVSRRRRFLALC
jgi:aldehyde dehydrogenase (NAD+)